MDQNLVILPNDATTIQNECVKLNSGSDTHLEELLYSFFVGLNATEDQIKLRLPVFADKLKMLNFELISEVLLNMIDNWTDSKAPTIGNIIEQYKLLKFRTARKTEKCDMQTAAAGAKYWTAYEECKQEGNKTLEELTRCIMQKLSYKLYDLNDIGEKNDYISDPE